MEALGRILEALEDVLEAFLEVLKASWKRQETGGALGSSIPQSMYARTANRRSPSQNLIETREIVTCMNCAAPASTLCANIAAKITCGHHKLCGTRHTKKHPTLGGDHRRRSFLESGALWFSRRLEGLRCEVSGFLDRRG